MPDHFRFYRFTHLCILVWIFFLCLTSIQGHASVSPSHKNVHSSSDVLFKVGLMPYPPFVLEKKENTNGFAVEIFDQITTALPIKTHKILMPKNLKKSFLMLEKGEVDALIGPLEISYDRLQKVDFSRPYFMEHVGLIILNQKASYWKTLKAFFSTLFDTYGLISLTCFLIASHLLWWRRRKKGEDLSPYPKSLGLAMWQAFLTLVRRDPLYSPDTTSSRIFMVLWIVFGLLFFSAILGSVTSAIDLSINISKYYDFSSAQDIKGHVIAVEKGSENIVIAQRLGAAIQTVKTLEEGLDLLKAQKVKAVITDYTVGQYALNTLKSPYFMLSKIILKNEQIGYAFSKGWKHLNAFNLELVRLQDNGSISGICRHFLGPQGKKSCDM